MAPRINEGHGSTEDIAHLVREFGGLQDTEVIVLDRNAQILGASGSQELIGRRLIRNEITRALTGQVDDAVRLDPGTNERRYYLAFPLTDERNSPGVIYLSGSLAKVDAILNEIKIILLTGAGAALAISFLLGIVLAKTITAPIQAVTNQAELMARGDFSIKSKVEASDEIGRLSETFNYLAERLSHNIKEISSEKSKVEAVINNMSDGVIALDGKGRLIHINPAAQELLKVLRLKVPVSGQSGFSLLKELIGADSLRSYLPGMKPLVVEISRNKPPCIVQAKLAPFKEEKGRMDGTLMVLHDVTGERELTKRQQEFVADVSHELRTPLATIKSYVETLLYGAAEDPIVRVRFLKVVEGETERMVSLVKDLLALSQLDYSQVEWHKTEVEINDMITEAVEQCRQKAGLELPEIEVVIPAELPAAYVDRGKIMQVFLNLLHNAIRYTPPDGKIKITAESHDEELWVMIKDSGVGMPPEDLERVFERFYRVEKTRSRDYGGTGLGLPIAQKFIDAHGGRIWLESSLGEGTRAWFSLPKVQASRGEQP